METSTAVLEKQELIDVEKNLEDHRRYWMGRRIQDVFLSVIALIILFPLMLIIALAVIIDDPSAGPIFVQTRVGLKGKPFKFYKFRSMCPNAEEKLTEVLDKNEADGPVFKIKDDPRITRVGKFIRRTSLDELPQLWNVLRGDMSIIGPRPALPREVEHYTEYDKQRLSITPGLSCYWQIAPHRHEMPFSEWVELDLKYIRERSFLVDWKIIFKTIQVCLHGNGD